MKRGLFYVLAMFACVGIFAQQQPVVAVAPFDAISGISATEANMITRVFFIRLGNTNKVSLVDRNVVDRVLREHQFQTGDWSNQQKTAELGKALNTDWIVRGELEKFGNNILVTVQFYDIQTFRFMGGSDLLLANAEEAMQKMDPLVAKLVETIASAGDRPVTSRQQGGNVAASAYYGTWLLPAAISPWKYDVTLSIDVNKVTCRGRNWHFVITNCTWTAENNGDIKTLADFPKGFKVSGIVTEDVGWGGAKSCMPIYLFIHKSDNSKIYWYRTPDNGEAQNSNADGLFVKVQ